MHSKPYSEVAPHVIERLEIAVLTSEVIQLQWADEHSDRAFMGKVVAQAVENADGQYYLLATDAHGEAVRARVDLIRNLPSPVK